MRRSFFLSKKLRIAFGTNSRIGEMIHTAIYKCVKIDISCSSNLSPLVHYSKYCSLNKQTREARSQLNRLLLQSIIPF